MKSLILSQALQRSILVIKWKLAFFLLIFLTWACFLFIYTLPVAEVTAAGPDLHSGSGVVPLHEVAHHVDGEREDDGAVLLSGYTGQGLQVPVQNVTRS